MDIKALILSKIRQKGEVKSAEVVRKTGFSRTYVNRFFQELIKEGKIEAIGKANQARYVYRSKSALLRARKKIKRKQLTLKNRGLNEDVVLGKLKAETGIWFNLPINISAILDYAFSEMLNNAIEHSRGSLINVDVKRLKDRITFEVADNGVGIFQTIRKKWGLKSDWEAIEQLIKGKQTTKPRLHTGEGIFFTSKAADQLTIVSAKKRLVFDNQLDDILIKDRTGHLKGTRVFFMVLLKSKRNLQQIFRRFSDDSLEFSKTKVTVRLYQKGVPYISRSQGRRIMTGLEKFKTVAFDFKAVEAIGQAFADEVFRVWQGKHKNVNLLVKNAQENVKFMIKRAMGINK